MFASLGIPLYSENENPFRAMRNEPSMFSVSRLMDYLNRWSILRSVMNVFLEDVRVGEIVVFGGLFSFALSCADQSRDSRTEKRAVLLRMIRPL